MRPPTDSEREDARIERAEKRVTHEAVWHDEPKRAKCILCRLWFDFDELSDEGMCGICTDNIEGYEEGRI
jgi:hypothetical protein